jgi:hypothetical protein
MRSELVNPAVGLEAFEAVRIHGQRGCGMHECIVDIVMKSSLARRMQMGVINGKEPQVHGLT